MRNFFYFLLAAFLISACQQPKTGRQILSLNGIWEITKTDSATNWPEAFTATVSVPGLVDLATPAIDEQDTAYNSAVYWYRRTFPVSELSGELVQLKINKAAYHTRVFVNGKFAGENTTNFTPTILNITSLVNPDQTENELVISVGCRNNLPDTVVNGWDFEKVKYIPGIYDDVSLISTGYPFINNVQTAPDIDAEQVRIVAELLTTDNNSVKIAYEISEKSSGKIVTQGEVENPAETSDGIRKIEFTVGMPGCILWSPETPFLYNLKLSTSADNATTAFGMRKFEASRDSGVFLLNNRPYYMRGTNVCIFRFFEDSERKSLPWNHQWVADLHKGFKDLHMNSMRYCIGFPPEKWYEIADSLGILIQDEYPIWTGGPGGFSEHLPGINARQIAAEYQSWMRERWNHPCVVVWDGQNESVNDTTAIAINMARNYDLSGRPWDNGWAAPASDRDAIESHPYLFTKYMGMPPGSDGYLKELLAVTLEPRNDPNEWSPAPDGMPYKNPVILNEYDWLWLNRDGSATNLTQWVYKNVFPNLNTPEQRFLMYAKNSAILTEYWRCHRKAAAVMHFCGLGYSRPTKPFGQTSDNFIDVANLVFEPNFHGYMEQAFSPVGLMTEFWERSMNPGERVVVPVHLINDTYDNYTDSVRLSVYLNDALVNSQKMPIQLDGLEKKVVSFETQLPTHTGNARIESEIYYLGSPVKSVREFKID